MADTTITGLPNATTPLTGAERVPMDQSGTTKDATTQDIANLAPATDLTYTAATRVLASSTGADATLPLATTTDAGLESAADKLKLDSITVDQAKTVAVAVRNVTGSTIGKGVPVYVTGSSGITVTVAPADASLEATAAGTLGITQAAIAHNTDGTVIAVGELTGLNTAALTEGAIIWLSETTGSMTTTRPTQPAHGVVLGYCVKQGSGTSGIIYVKVDNGLELEELHDVLISAATTGQVLRRASDGLWKNATLGAADVSGLATVASTGAYSDLSGRPTLGTAAPLDVAAAGDASASQVVKGNDSRLSDARTPTAHNQAASTISDSTSAGRALLTAADAAAQRTALGLGSLATQSGTFSGTSSGTNTGDQTITLTGDVTGSGTGSFAATLSSTAVTPGSYTYGSFTVDAKGRITAASSGTAPAALSSTTPAALGTAAVGTGSTAARADHVHAMPSASDVGALPSTFAASTLTYAATTDLDMAALAGGYRTLSLTGNVTFTTSNRASGRTVVIRIICDSTQRTLTFPAGWVFVGTKPANIAASKTAVLSLSFFGTADTDCVAAYGVQS